jgi:hypothetical protein
MDSTALALVLAAFGVLLIALSYQRHRHRRNPSALAHGISGALLFIGGASLLALALNFNTYDELRANQPVAELSIEQSGPQTYQVRLMRIPAGDLQVFALKGTRWQIEARALYWRGWPAWLGLNANIRLERLHLLSDRTSTSPRVYQLNRTPGLRLLALKQAHPDTLDFLDIQTLLSDAFPLQDGLRFHIYCSNGQLLARAVNQPRTPKTRPSPIISYEGTALAATSGDAGTATSSSSTTPSNNARSVATKVAATAATTAR